MSDKMPEWFQKWRCNEFYHMKVKLGITFYLVIATLGGVVALILTRAFEVW